MKVSTILEQIDLGSYALPEFQRGYVWNRAQVRGFMDSLYREHPVGSLLTWRTRTEDVDARGDGELQPGTVQLLLDGQQRISTLYGLIRGKQPPFFDGNANVFDGLKFHLEDEAFEYYQPVKMGGDDRWIDVIELFQSGAGKMMAEVYRRYESELELAELYGERLNRLDSIRNRDFHIEEVTGEDKTIEQVVDIFNRVNSGGTKLKSGDLALAKLCAEWPQARAEMKVTLDRLAGHGFTFTLDFLLRVVNAVVTRRAPFSALAEVTGDDFREGLAKTAGAIDRVLNALASRLGIDNSTVLPSPFPIVILARYLVDNDMSFGDERQKDRLLYWYVQAAIWGRYTSGAEGRLAQDLLVLDEDGGDPVDRLLANLLQQRGDLTVRPDDFRSWGRGARFFPILYMLGRRFHARDWGTGNVLQVNALGGHSDLELHHIFPKSLLYEIGHPKSEVNALANFTFLTLETNRDITNRRPDDYLPQYSKLHPGAIESTWVPMDTSLWELDRYEDFLAARRELLAAATNDFLAQLLGSELPVSDELEVIDGGSVATPAEADDEDAGEAVIIAELRAWLGAQGLGLGSVNFELVADDGSQIASFDVAWPTGLQGELSEPVVLLIDEPESVYRAAVQHGYLPFTDADALRAYATALAGETDG